MPVFREQRLLKFEGLIPIYHKREKYNLPVVIWLPESFPLGAPLAYVVRDPDQFVFNVRCSIVDPTNNGQITSDYLKNWAYPSSNLRDCIGDMQVYFTENPPLYAKSTNVSGSAAHRNKINGIHGMNPLATGVAGGNGVAQVQQAYGNPVHTPWQPSPTQMQPAPSPPRPSIPPAIPPGGNMHLWSPVKESTPQHQSQAEGRQLAMRQQRDAAYRLALSTALSVRVASALEAEASTEKAKQLSIKRELESRSTLLSAEVKKLQDERTSLDSAAQELAGTARALDRWLSENEPRIMSLQNNDVYPEETIVPADELSAQALSAQAADIGLEDTLSALDRAFESNVIDLTKYLRLVRVVSRMQFTARALSKKIAAKQLAERTSPQRPPSASLPRSQRRESLPPVVSSSELPIGDMWYGTGGILTNPLAAAAQNLR